ncbi:MAG: hypothetical protein ACFFER_08800 [Candidatus Thorarchaeota archaeon]
MSLVKWLCVAFVATTLILASAPAVQAKQYRSTMKVYFNPGVFNDPPEYIWKGTISGDIDGTMTFWATGPIPAKDLGHPPGFFWQVHFFTEYWEIIDGDGDMIAGIDKGQTGYSNWKFRMNGQVTVATGKYSDLVGHKVHMNGEIDWDQVFVSGIAIGPVLIN